MKRENIRREKLIILLGVLVALVFLAIGFQEWLDSKPQSELPPVVVNPMPPAGPLQEEKTKVSEPEQPPVAQKEEQKQPPDQQKKQEQRQPQEDQIAKKIEEEKKKETEEKKVTDVKRQDLAHLEQKKTPTPKAQMKEYTIQIGAFSSKENAEKTLSKAKKMGYTASIVNEDDFYKVRVKVRTDDPNREIAKLRSAFGSAFIKQ